MNLKEIERRLTGNVSTYPNWINEIHKDLMLQYYKDDVDEKDINLKLSKIINQDFNDRYFPAKYPLGQSLEDRIKEEELRAKIELRDKKPEIKEIASKDIENPINKEDLKNMIEESVSNNLGSALSKGVETLAKQIEQQQHPLEEYESLDIKEIAKAEKDKKAEEQARLQLNLMEEQNMIQNEIEGKPPANSYNFELNTPPISPTPSEAPSEAPTEAPTVTSSEDLLNNNKELLNITSHILHNVYNFYNEKVTHEGENVFKYKAYTKANFQKIRTEFRKLALGDTNDYKLTSKNGSSTIVIKTNTADNKIISFVNIDKNGKEHSRLIPSKPTDSNIDKKLYEDMYDFIHKGVEENHFYINSDKKNEMKATGIKNISSKKTLNWMRNRFQILKGEVLAGNDNPNVVAEIKQLISELQKQGQLVKC
jgi:hypothetical protein